MRVNQKDQAFCHAQQQTIDRQKPELVNDSSQRCEDTPEDERVKDQSAGAGAPRIGDAGDLEEEISQEEERAEQRGLRIRDVERLCQAGGRAESIVCAIEIRQAVGYEDGGQQVEPAPPQFSLKVLRVPVLSNRHTSFIAASWNTS
jgi:hypothetical protein